MRYNYTVWHLGHCVIGWRDVKQRACFFSKVFWICSLTENIIAKAICKALWISNLFKTFRPLYLSHGFASSSIIRSNVSNTLVSDWILAKHDITFSSASLKLAKHFICDQTISQSLYPYNTQYLLLDFVSHYHFEYQHSCMNEQVRLELMERSDP